MPPLITLIACCALAAAPTVTASNQTSSRIFLTSSPNNLGCHASINGSSSEVKVTCRPSTTTEPPDDLTKDNMSALLIEATNRLLLPGDAIRFLDALVIYLERVICTELAINKSAIATVRHALPNPSLLRRVAVQLNGTRLTRLDIASLRALAQRLELTADSASWLGSATAAANFEWLSIAMPSPARGLLRNLRADSAEVRLTSPDVASPRRNLLLANVSVAGRLTVSAAVASSLSATVLSLGDGVAVRELHLRGRLVLARPRAGTPLATSLKVLIVEAGAELASANGSLEDLQAWAPGLRLLQLPLAGALDDIHWQKQLAQLFSGRRLLPMLIRLKIGDSIWLRLSPASASGQVSRCSELGLLKSPDPVECDCRLGWLLTRCPRSGSVARCASAGAEPSAVAYEAFHSVNCTDGSGGLVAAGASAEARGDAAEAQSSAPLLSTPLAVALAVAFLVASSAGFLIVCGVRSALREPRTKLRGWVNFKNGAENS